MKGNLVPEQDHISRYASAMRCTEDGEVTGAAFMLRHNEEFLSVNWLEFFHLDNRQEEIRAVRNALRVKLGAKAKIAIMNIGEIINYK